MSLDGTKRLSPVILTTFEVVACFATELEGDKSRAQVLLHFQNDEKSISGGLFQVKYAPISLLTLEAYRLQLFDSQKDDLSENVNITGFNVNYNRLRHHKIHAWWGLEGFGWMPITILARSASIWEPITFLKTR